MTKMPERYDYKGSFVAEDNNDRSGFPRRYYIELSCSDRKAPPLRVEIPVEMYQDMIDMHDGRPLDTRVSILVGKSISRLEIDVLIQHKDLKKE